jgi:predicted  nucleic acid-binding Zn-ribbon protein
MQGLRGELRSEAAAIRAEVAELRTEISGLRDRVAALEGAFEEMRRWSQQLVNAVLARPAA